MTFPLMSLLLSLVAAAVNENDDEVDKVDPMLRLPYFVFRIE